MTLLYCFSYILVIIDSHGALDEQGEHIIPLDNTHHQKYTKDIFKILKDVFGSKAIEVVFTPCHGGGALKDANLLPQDSKLLVLSKPDHIVSTRESIEMFESIIDYKNKPESFGSIIDYESKPEEFSIKSILTRYLLSLQKTNNIPGIAISGKNSYFLDEFSKPLGKLMSSDQQELITEKLAKYCNNCKEYISKAIKKIESSSDIKDLYAPSTLFECFVDQYIKPNLLNADFRQFSCSAKVDIEVIENYLSHDFLKASTDTNYGICKNKYIPEIISIKCQELNPEIPLFGTALAILYELESIQSSID